MFQRVSKGLVYFEDYIRKYVKDLKSQLILLNLLEELVCEEDRYLTVIYNIFHQLSQELELVKDEVVVYWYKNGGHRTEKFPLIAKKVSFAQSSLFTKNLNCIILPCFPKSLKFKYFKASSIRALLLDYSTDVSGTFRTVLKAL